MYNGKKILAIIPARSGSKGLPGKNIIIMNGKPLISWSIQAGLESRYIDIVMVSTDSKDYAEISKKSGASVPFLRPEDLSTDLSQRRDVIEHTLSYYKSEGQEFDYLVLLEPTSPLRTAKHIDEAIEQLFSSEEAESIVGVSQLESFHPSFVIGLNNGFLSFLNRSQESKVLRRQDLEDFYFYEGSLYISKVDCYLEKEFYHEKTLGYVVPRWMSLEVDEIEDFVMIEALMKHKGYK